MSESGESFGEKSSESSGDEAGGGGGVSRERGGDAKGVTSASRNRSGDTGGLEGEEGEEKTGLPIMKTSAVLEFEYCLRNYTTTTTIIQ